MTTATAHQETRVPWHWGARGDGGRRHAGRCCPRQVPLRARVAGTRVSPRGCDPCHKRHFVPKASPPGPCWWQLAVRAKLPSVTGISGLGSPPLLSPGHTQETPSPLPERAATRKHRPHVLLGPDGRCRDPLPGAKSRSPGAPGPEIAGLPSSWSWRLNERARWRRARRIPSRVSPASLHMLG